VVGGRQTAARSGHELLVLEQEIAEQQVRQCPRSIHGGDGDVEGRYLAARAQRALQAQADRHAAPDPCVEADRLVDQQAPAGALGIVVGQLPAELEEVHVAGRDRGVAHAAVRNRDRGTQRHAAAERERRDGVQADPLACQRQRDEDGRRDGGGHGRAASGSRPTLGDRGGVGQRVDEDGPAIGSATTV